MKLHLNKKEFNSYIGNLIKESISGYDDEKCANILNIIADEWGKDSDFYSDAEDAVVASGMRGLMAVLENYDCLDYADESYGQEQEEPQNRFGEIYGLPEDDDDEPDSLDEARSYVRSIVEGTLKRLPAELRESFFESMYEKEDKEEEDDEEEDADGEYFDNKDAHGNTVVKSEQAFSEAAISMLQDPIVNRDALADEIEGLNDLAEGSARSYLSKVAAGKRPLPDDIAKAIVERINAIGKTKR